MTAPYDDPLLYDLRTAELRDDLRFFLRESARAGDPVLELACGTGRVALPLAQQGIRMVGLDLDPAMLAHALRKAHATATDLPLLRADMRRFAFAPRFRLVFVAYSSLRDLPAVEDWERCFRCVAGALAPGGVFLLDDEAPPPAGGAREGRFVFPGTAAGTTVDGRVRWELHPSDQTTRGEMTYELQGADGQRKARTYPFRGSYAAPAEIVEMLERSGLRLVDRFADPEGNPWREGIARTLYRAVRT
ncbi:MAG: class I SAM-dependent methyltransferase [Planctomycetes bacterium]|nr:class I SAM-dependent methyltransferase [Planctomycetota bacterium]